MLYNLLQWADAKLVDLGLYHLFQVLYQLEFRAFAAVVTSFAIVVLFGRRFIRWLVAQKIADDGRSVDTKALDAVIENRTETPTMGGLLIGAAILVTTLLLADLTERHVHLAILTLVWLGGLGCADDWLKLTAKRRDPGARQGLHAWEKLLFQTGLAVALAWALFTRPGEAARVLVLPFQRTYVPGTFELEPGVIVLGLAAFLVIAVLVVVLTSNAVNLTDGMDGLAPGTVLVAAFTMMVLCSVAGVDENARTLSFPHVPGTSELMVVTGAMAGACLGFLWFNCHPAQVYMGDTGSLSLGGLLAYVAVAVRQEFLLLVLGAVFFMEAASVILQVGWFKWTRRTRGEGVRVFRMAPIHHHFQLGGWSVPQTVTRFWVLAVAFAMAALVSLKLR